jgi:hypothetical protein
MRPIEANRVNHAAPPPCPNLHHAWSTTSNLSLSAFPIANNLLPSPSQIWVPGHRDLSPHCPSSSSPARVSKCLSSYRPIELSCNLLRWGRVDDLLCFLQLLVLKDQRCFNFDSLVSRCPESTAGSPGPGVKQCRCLRTRSGSVP